MPSRRKSRQPRLQSLSRHARALTDLHGGGASRLGRPPYKACCKPWHGAPSEVSSSGEGSKTTGKVIVTLTRPMLALLRRLIVAACWILLASHPVGLVHTRKAGIKYKKPT